MHYRARGSIGFLKIKKVVISKHLFHIKEKPPNKKFCTYWDGYDPNFAPNIFRNFLESKYCQNHDQCSEKVEGGLSKGLVFFMVKI